MFSTAPICNKRRNLPEIKHPFLSGNKYLFHSSEIIQISNIKLWPREQLNTNGVASFQLFSRLLAPCVPSFLCAHGS